MLFRTLRPDEIDIRVALLKDSGAQFLLYKNARTDMDILDETVGAENWQRKHFEHKGNIYCAVGIYSESRGEWIWKEDAGAESNTEAEKGEASDSFKRACVNHGIGRELYTSPFIWIDGCTAKDDRGKINLLRDYKSLRVSAIEYDDNRSITKLAIRNGRGKVVYTFENTPANAPKTRDINDDGNNTPANEEPRKSANRVIKCEKCGNEIKPYFNPDNGKTFSPEAIATTSRIKYGHAYCVECAQAAKNNEN